VGRLGGSVLAQTGAKKRAVDFYTVGFRNFPNAEALVETLRRARVGTLVDLRNLPRSRWMPWTNQKALEGAVRAAGMAYVHLPEMGVARAQRERVWKGKDYGTLWRWYDRRILPRLPEALARLEGLPKPWAIACMEADPLRCHRHRVAASLGARGLRGRDILPVGAPKGSTLTQRPAPRGRP
jgi:uncharacterized protein (DUF488 family)